MFKKKYSQARYIKRNGTFATRRTPWSSPDRSTETDHTDEESSQQRSQFTNEERHVGPATEQTGAAS